MDKPKQSVLSLTIPTPSDADGCSPIRQAAKTPSHVRLNMYPNRRLYARGWGSYITVKDLVPHVRNGGTIEVKCTTTRLDITQRVLKSVLALMAEESEAGPEALYAAIRKGSVA